MRRREKAIIILLALFFVSGLLGVNSIWPEGFGIFVAIGGTAGALMVLYEVRLTKQIAQAEFIRDLQSSFVSDPNIGQLWNKLLLQEPITQADRGLMSNYLTFFETLHLLQAKGALDLSLTDDLFRNRFFTAIGHPAIQEYALVKSAGSFQNIHDLVKDWHDYLVRSGKAVPAGYYTYVLAMVEAKGYTVQKLDQADLSEILSLQDRVIANLQDPSQLRKNSAETFLECLTSQSSNAASPQHIVMGALSGTQLVAAVVLFDGGQSDENIHKYFSTDETVLSSSVNLKLVLTDPNHRRSGLGRSLIELVEPEAASLQKTAILCTIHRSNVASRELFRGLKYRYRGQKSTKYGHRYVYLRKLPASKLEWSR